MIRDFRGQAVMVTGGTKGIGLATALAFAGFGAKTVLTYGWGSADEDAVRRRFSDLGAPEPVIVQADVSAADDTERLMADLSDRFPAIDVLVSNAGGAVLATGLEDLTERALLKTMSYSVWPLVGYLQAIERRFGTYPRHVVAISSSGPDHYSLKYDLMGASKAALESLCRYLAYRLRNEPVNLNVVRTVGLVTETFAEAFGPELVDTIRLLAPEKRLIEAEEVAEAVVALCSGLLDGMTGQVLTVDRGGIFADNVMRLYDERKDLGLSSDGA